MSKNHNWINFQPVGVTLLQLLTEQQDNKRNKKKKKICEWYKVVFQQKFQLSTIRRFTINKE